MRPRRIGVALGMLALMGADGTRPPLGPARPTLVHYHIDNAQSAVPPDFDVLFAPGGQRARVRFSGPTGYLGQSGYLLIDAARRRMVLVMDQPSISVALPTPAMFAPYFEWRDTLSFVRRGEAHTAAGDCRWWETRAAEGRARICFSDDGIPLRIAASGKHGDTEVEASSLQQQPDDPAAFRVPADHPELGIKGLSPFGDFKGS